MSAAATADAGDAPKKKGSKKLLIIIAAVVLLALVGGGAAVFMMKKNAAHAAEGEEEHDGPAKKAPPKPAHDAKHAPPAFVPLDPFTVNLADRDAERYAQVAVTLELIEPGAAEEIKNYMPAIRNGVLMILAHKTSADLLERAGKEKVAAQIGREAARAMGYDVEEPEDEEETADEPEDDKAAKKKKKRKPKKTDEAAAMGPIKRVLFANIIIQ